MKKSYPVVPIRLQFSISNQLVSIALFFNTHCFSCLLLRFYV